MKFLVKVFLLLLPAGIYSQDQLQGIYKFKPGVTTIEVIQELEKETKIKIETTSDFTKFYEKTGYKYKGGKLIKKDAFLNLVNKKCIAENDGILVYCADTFAN